MHRQASNAMKKNDVDSIQSRSVMAFLQARMGSRRLPGKVLKAIQGQTILERAIRRLRASAVVEEVVVLTTQCREDDAIVRESQRLNAPVYRGPELDVLARFYEAYENFRPGIIIRATADNPLIDIGSIERIVETLSSNDLDFCMEDGLPYGAATEAFTAEALSRAHLQAKDARHREHVTLYMKEHPEEYCSMFPLPPDYLRFPQVRITVDTAVDLHFVSRLICQLPEGPNPLPLGEYLPLALSVLSEGEYKALSAS